MKTQMQKAVDRMKEDYVKNLSLRSTAGIQSHIYPKSKQMLCEFKLFICTLFYVTSYNSSRFLKIAA
jgi:hypothetical protein